MHNGGRFLHILAGGGNVYAYWGDGTGTVWRAAEGRYDFLRDGEWSVVIINDA